MGEVYPDEIDPEWADRPDEASGEADRVDAADSARKPDRADEPSGGDPPR
jgi:hypothetical protein